MSETRRAVREVPAQDTVATRLADKASAYVVYVSDSDRGVRIPVAFTPKFTGENAAALNAAFVKNATLGASNALKDSTDSDEARAAFCHRYVNEEYKFSGSDLGDSLVKQAAILVAREMARAQNSHPSEETVVKTAEQLLEVGPDRCGKDQPDITYLSRINAACATVLAERPRMQKRGAKAKTEGDSIEL